MARNGSMVRASQCLTKSALDRNFSASANSKKPRITLMVFIQLPDLGKDCMILGKAANTANGSASPKPKPPIPAVSCQAPPLEVKAPASSEPRIGPVQEKDTKAKVSAAKKIPIPPPRFSALLELLTHELGKANS